jgi:multidrug efflux system membrane fusion protein
MRRAITIALVVWAAASLAAGCAQSSNGQTSAKARVGAAAGAVPVTVTEAAWQDVPIYLNGLGTVQAFNTATLRAQVSGRLIAVPFKEGDEVQAGAVLALVDPRTYQATLDQAIAKKAQDEAQLAAARLDLKRYQDLLPQGYVTQQQVDQQRAVVEQDAALIQSDTAAIESARVQLSFCTITAPFAGVVGLRQVDVGNLVSASDQTGIVVLTQIKPIAITFTLPEQDFGELRAAEAKAGGDPLPVLAVSRDNQTVLAHGHLLALDNQIDQTTGTIKLKASFDNADKALWPGQFVNVRLLLRTERQALTVPTVAVQLGPEGSYVYVVDQNQTAQMRPVEVTRSEGGLALIAKGLTVGERVVVDGQSRLQPGSKVQASVAQGTPVPAAEPKAAQSGSR